jgi:hypothetical protein
MKEIEIPEHWGFTSPRPKGRKIILLGSLIIIPLCLAIPFVYFAFSSDRELQAALAEADRLDPGWRIPALEEKRKTIPDAENSGPVLIAAKTLMPPNWPSWDHPQAAEKGKLTEEELRTLQKSLSELKPCEQLDERQTAALREELQRAGNALTAVRRVADLPRGRFPITYTKDYILTVLPCTEDARTMGTLFAYDVLVRAQDEDMDGALTSCRGILNCGRVIGDEPTLISMMVRIGLIAAATKRVERTLAQGAPSDHALSTIQHEFEREAEEPLLLIGARGERGMIDGLMEAIQAGDLKPTHFFWVNRDVSSPGQVGVTASEVAGRSLKLAQLLRVPGMAKNIRAVLLGYNNRFVEIAKLPVEQQVERIKDREAAEQDLPELALPIFRADRELSDAFHRCQAELRCAVVMLALERYRRANNRWPDFLTDLVPAYLPAIPLDPYDGIPLRYRRLDDGVVIYSVGPDGKDNGGNVEGHEIIVDELKLGADLGFCLWDVPNRRQPPNPP